MIKSPLRYPGGKSRAVKIISPIIPEFKEFREPMEHIRIHTLSEWKAKF